MLKSFIFENFKSFEKAELLLEDFTTLIGTNASGKSNAIEGIKILAETVTGLDLSTILDGSKNNQSTIRGGSKSCCRFHCSWFRLGCTIDLDEDYDLYYSIKINVGEHIYVAEEQLYKIENNQIDLRKGKIFKTKIPISKESGDISVEYKNGSRGRNPELICIRSSSILSQMKTKMERESSQGKESGTYIDLVINQLKNILVLNPVPYEMRSYARKNDVDLKIQCDNISSVLQNICKDQKSKTYLLETINQLPENKITDIEFIETKLGDVIFALREKYQNVTEIVDARMLSDGTLRSIAMLAAVFQCPENSMLVIEEIDNGIHPGKVTQLIECIAEIGIKRHVDIIVTTHNAALLNRYTKERLIGVSVVYRESQRGTSKFVAFVDIEDYPKLLASGGLGNAMIDDALIMAIKQEKKEVDYSWLGV